MTTAFSPLDATSSDECDSIFGENVFFRPMAPSGGHLAARPDPNRAMIRAVGIVENEVVNMPTKGDRRSDADRADVAGLRSSVSVQSRYISDAVAAGDIIELSDRDGSPQFRVTLFMPDGVGRTNFLMVKI